MIAADTWDRSDRILRTRRRSFGHCSARACNNCYHVGMKKKANNALQYTIRGISPEVDRVLRLKASHSGQSLNQVIVDELTRVAIGNPQRADFTDLVGKWTPDAAFDEVLASQRHIDHQKWNGE